MKIAKPILVAACCVFAGCVSRPPRVSEPAAGNPEVTITGKDATRIKSIIIGEAVNRGFTIERDRKYSLVLTKPGSGMDAFIYGMSNGNADSGNMVVLSYTFAKSDGKVRVVMALETRTQLPGGRTSSKPWPLNDALRKVFQFGLNEVKRRAELASGHG
jgi:hypothetical protein